jgi:cell fate regulator YaaT (PSP1 superfamily)
VHTSKGIELGKIVSLVSKDRCVEDEIQCKYKVNKQKNYEKSILRIATEEDKKKYRDNQEKAKISFKIFQKKIKKYKLPMKPITSEYTLNLRKIVLYFSADDRVDFRILVKDLASTFKTKVELKQIGKREESKIMGGVGICGRPFCCSTFLNNFQPVLVKNVKEQGMLLNSSKVSGSCGRLCCCLNYEEDFYQKALKTAPKVGDFVLTCIGEGFITEVNLIKESAKIKLNGNDIRNIEFKDVIEIKSRDEEKSDLVEKKVTMKS